MPDLSQTQHWFMKLHLTELLLAEPLLERLDRHAFVQYVCAKRLVRRVSPTHAMAAANLLAKGLLAEASVFGRSAAERSMTIRLSAAGAGVLYTMLEETIAALKRPEVLGRRAAGA